MRIDELTKILVRRKLDQIVVTGEADILALAGINCDNGILDVRRTANGRTSVTFYTDFRYVPMVHRVAPDLRCRDIKSFTFVSSAIARASKDTRHSCRVDEKGTRHSCRVDEKGTRHSCRVRIGIEHSISHERYLTFVKSAPRSATFVDLVKDLESIRMTKTPEEIEKLRAAEQLVCEIWNDASRSFEAGMTERQMAAIIKKMMIDRGEGEAFATIVCVGKNAAECHHEPDDTVWNGREPVLVDIGVKLNGVCSDLTRNLVPRASSLYRKIYRLVLEANQAAIAAAKPGMTGRQLDKVARDVIRKGGFGKCFGHSLGHGVGYEIHEAPTASKKSKTVLKPGMAVTIEPGIYLEDNLGVRIEDLVLITETGCEVLSAAAAKAPQPARR